MKISNLMRLGVLPILGAWLGCNAIIGLELGEPEDAGTGDTLSTGSGSSGGNGGQAATGAGGTGGSAQGATTGMGGAGGGMPSICGNGTVGGGEACDDGNSAPGDGCAECDVELGYTCAGEPSDCEPISPQLVTVGPGLGIGIADVNNGYQGAIATMQCATVPLLDGGFSSIQWVEVTVGIQHPSVGDLVIKLVSPAGTTLSLLSRPGLDEPIDAYDEDNGDLSGLAASHPITFKDGAGDDAETMGTSTSNDMVVCRDDGRCVYAPSPGAGPGIALSDFVGEDPVGDWLLCVADGDTSDAGSIDQVTLVVLAW